MSRVVKAKSTLVVFFPTVQIFRLEGFTCVDVVILNCCY